MTCAKDKFLKQMKSESDRLLVSKVFDMISECDKYYRIAESNFLNGYEAAIAKTVLLGTKASFGFFGGYDDAERVIAYVYPDYLKPQTDDLSLSVIKISGRDLNSLSHRDYLGSILALGLKREKIGDIVLNDDSAFVICKSDIADYITSQLRKIGNKGVKLELQDVGAAIIPQKRFKETNCTVASLRLDAIVSSAANISRSSACDLIRHEAVSVNWMPVLEASFNISESDLLSVKGHGRFLISQVNGFTRKGRTSITVRKYI